MAGKSLSALNQKYRGKPKKYADGGRVRRPAAAPVASPFDADYIERLATQAVGAGEPVTEVRSSEGRGFAPMPRSFGEAGQRMSAVIRGDVEPTPEEERQMNVVRGFAEGPASIRAYHGSPYAFERFDISKIGAGEGNQIYGRGLYFADLERIARDYRDRLAHKGQIDLEYEASRLGLPTSRESNLTIRRLGKALEYDPQQAAYFAQAGNSELRAYDQSKIADLIKAYRDSSRGHMYEVQLRTTPEQLLSLDAPIATQPRNIRDELKSAGILKAYRENLSDFSSPMQTRNKNARGENIMSFLEHAYGGPKGASRTLTNLGIPGVRYLDEASRAAGRGTHNYVMFGDDLIDITRRYAEGGLAALDQKYADGGTVRAPKETYISGQEHKLAYITDREAALLKARGGSGRMTEHGVRAYDEGGDGPGGSDSDSSNSNSEAGTQDAADGNAGQGAGPTGAGAGSGPGQGGPSATDTGGMANADPEGTAAAANAQTASQAQQAGVRGADTEGFAPSGFSPSMSLGEAIGALGRGDIGLAEAIGLGLQSALAPPGVTVGVNVDETGNRAPAVSIDPLGVAMGLAGLATGVPGLGMVGGMIGSQIGNAVGMAPSVVGYSPGYGGEPTESPGGIDQYTEYGRGAYGLPAQTNVAASTAPLVDWNQIQREANAMNMSVSDYLATKWRSPANMARGGMASLEQMHAKYAEGGEVYPPAGEIAEYDPDEIDRIARQIHLRLPEDERQDVVYEEAASPSDLTMRARMMMRGQNIGMPEAISAGAGNDRFSSATSLRDMPIEDDRYGVSHRTLNTSIDAVLDAERKARIGAGMLALERGGEKGFTGYGPQVSAGYGPLSVHGGYQSITPNMPGAKSQGSYVYGGNLNIPIDDGGTEANIGATVTSGRRRQDGTQITGSLERPFLGGRLGLDVSADPSLRNKEILLGYRRAF